MSIASLNNFCLSESIEKKYIVNKNLNAIHKNTKLIQGFLVSSIGN